MRTRDEFSVDLFLEESRNHSTTRSIRIARDPFTKTTSPGINRRSSTANKASNVPQPRDPDVAGFRLYRRAEEETSARLVADLPAEVPSYLDRNVRAGTRYVYTVTAVDDQTPPNESEASEPATERPQGSAAGETPP